MYVLSLALAFILACLPGVASATGENTPAANPPQSVVVISSTAIPFIKASSGTMGNNCAISAMTALPRTFSGGGYLYLPASAIEAGSAAGWYWFVASSTTAGTCYNSTYTSGHPRAGTTTAFATTGPGAYTGVTTTVTGPSVTIPANLMGVNGRIFVNAHYSNNNSAGTKASNIRLGGTSCAQQSATTGTNYQGTCDITNRGTASIQAVQTFYNAVGSVVNQVNLATDMTNNTAVATTLDITLITSGAATDHAIIEAYSIEVYPRN